MGGVIHLYYKQPEKSLGRLVPILEFILDFRSLIGSHSQLLKLRFCLEGHCSMANQGVLHGEKLAAFLHDFRACNGIY